MTNANRGEEIQRRAFEQYEQRGRTRAGERESTTFRPACTVAKSVVTIFTVR